MLVAGFFGHGQQGVHRQHGHTPGPRAKGQALRYRTGGAQAGEGTRAAPEDDGVERRKGQPGAGHTVADGGDQRGRRLRAPGAGVHPHAVAVLDGNGQGFGAGVEGKQVHGGAVWCRRLIS